MNALANNVHFFFFFRSCPLSLKCMYVLKVGCKLAYLTSQPKMGMNKELFMLQTCPQSIHISIPLGKIWLFGFLSLPAFACLCEK